MIAHVRLLLRDIRAKLGARAVILLGLLVAVAVLEAVSMGFLLPLLDAIGIGGQGGQGAASRLFDSLFRHLGVHQTVGVVAVFAIGAFLVQYAVFLVESRLAADLQSRYTAMWRNELFSSTMQASWRLFLGARSGELVNTIIGETNRLSGAFFLVVQLAAALVVTLAYTLFALFAAWQITVAMVAVGAAALVLTRRIARQGHRIGVELSARNEELQGTANEFVSGAKLVKATASEELAAERFATVVDRLSHLYAVSSLQPNLLRAIFEFSAVTTLVAMLVVGTRVLHLGSATIFLVLALFVRLYPRLSSVQQNLQMLNVYVPAIETTTELAARARAEAEPLDERPLPAALRDHSLSLELEGLTVRYHDRAVLDGVALTVPAGQAVAIVGASGAGKSTLVDCLLKLVAADEGVVLVNDVPLDDLPLRAWRRVVGYVAQDTFLFNATVRDNITWGLRDCADAAVIEAARRANAHDFITAMPAGYDTVVGDRGVRMSGGQRQRIGLARALVARPRLLLLDEATSALDSGSELAVLDAIERLHGDVTVVMVAHRLATVRRADSIHVLEDGRVTESGTWDALLLRNERFGALWKLQNAAP